MLLGPNSRVRRRWTRHQKLGTRDQIGLAPNTVNKKEGGKFLENLDQLKNFLYKEYLDNTGKLLISDYNLKYYNKSLKGVKLHNQNYYDGTLNEFSPNNVAMFNDLGTKYIFFNKY